jgi:hypothetical protein
MFRFGVYTSGARTHVLIKRHRVVITHGGCLSRANSCFVIPRGSTMRVKKTSRRLSFWGRADGMVSTVESISCGSKWFVIPVNLQG